MQITTHAQLTRTVQALNETFAVIERLQAPKRTSREEAQKLIAELTAHAAMLQQMIATAQV
jgi:hypothetical protein